MLKNYHFVLKTAKKYRSFIQEIAPTKVLTFGILHNIIIRFFNQIKIRFYHSN